MSPISAVATSYDFVLVTLSVIIAILGFYAALVIAGRIRATTGVSHYLWLLCAGLLMGGGIWSMHFVGMLALQIPVPVSYDPWLTLLSLLVPLIVTAAGFRILVVRGSGPLILVGAGLLMCFGLVAMHYTGMAAMRVPAHIEHQPLLVAVSVLIAVGASIAALGLAFGLQTMPWHRVAGAAVMGMGGAGMHYTAMAAVDFTVGHTVPMPPVAMALDPALLGIVITAATFVLLFLGLLSALLDRRYTALTLPPTVLRAAERAPNPGRRFDPYSPKIALLAIILFFVVVIGVSWGLTAWRDYEEAIEEVQIVTRSTARLVEEHVDRAIGAGDLVLQHVAGLIEQLGVEAVVSSPAIWESVRRMEASLPHLDSVSILDAQGNLLFTTKQFPAPRGFNFAGQAYFQALQMYGGPELLVSETSRGAAADGDFFNVGRRLTGPDGRFAGVVLMSVHTTYFTDFYAGLKLGPNSAVSMFREDGTLLTRQPPPPDSMAGASQGQLVRMYLQRSLSGTFESRSPRDGAEHIVSYRHAASLPLVVTASTAKETALAEWRTRLHRNAALGLVIVATLSALSWLAVRSLQREERAANALRRAHDDLERRVRERTAELEAALADKEILFKEVHHRVKNNLQVICSLLNLQSSRFGEPAVRRAFDEAYNRVYSISLVHKALYDQNAAAQIDFASYLRDLCDSLSKVYGASARNIEIEVSAAESTLDLNRAVPLALIVNEVISNALKHAFPDGRAGRIVIEFAVRQSGFRLTIRDNGIGIREGATRGPAKSLGLVIVNALAHQIDATVTYRRDAGTRFELLSGPGEAEKGADAATGADGDALPSESAAAQ